jgi:cytochrome c2
MMARHHTLMGFMLLTIWLLATAVAAQNVDLLEGEKLYLKECGVCHGTIGSSETSQGRPVPLLRHLAPVVRASASPGNSLYPLPVSTGVFVAAAPRPRVVIAPPFGPNLRGVYGRPAGTVKGFNYSRAFLNALHGMEWNYSTLDVWLTNTQAWVPGVRMFYKQPDAEIRRRIILYLQAHP